ncbi:PIN domain-containing protein [Puniceicoccaceae bacterium K14]|nr:PIN domain-containing protein [Puniceicoccaceae bacterium K14]
MKVLLDTNVILDVWLAREPFWKDSAILLAKVEKKQMEGWICPTTITTLHCLGKKVLGEQKTRELLDKLISICKVGKMSRQTFKRALESQISDFEDAVIEAVSIGNNIELIATRNIGDFKKSEIPAKEPSQIN